MKYTLTFSIVFFYVISYGQIIFPDSLCFKSNAVEEYIEIVLKDFPPNGKEIDAANGGHLILALRKQAIAYCTSKLTGKSNIVADSGKAKILYFNGYKCESDWNNSCTGEMIVMADEGWEVCGNRYR